MMKFFYTLLLSCIFPITIYCMEEEKEKKQPTKKIEIIEEPKIVPTIIIQPPKKKKELFTRKSYYDDKTAQVNTSPLNTSPRLLKENIFFTVIKNKDYTTLQNLLVLNLNSTDKNGNTSLHIAAREGFIKIVEILLKQKNLNLNFQNIGKLTALHLAAQRKHYAIVDLLLQNPGCDSSITTMDGKTTVRELIEISQIDYRRKCFAYVTLNWEINRQTKIHCTSTNAPSLEIAVKNIKNDILETYNEQPEEDRNIPKEAQLGVTDEFIYLMLKLRIEAFQRANCNNISSSKSDTQLIITKTTEPNKNNEQQDKKKKHSPLTKKSKSYHTSDDSIETTKNNPLIIATKANDLATVIELLKRDPNDTDINGNTPLIYATTLGDAKAVDILLLNKIKLNEKNKWGMTAFLIA